MSKIDEFPVNTGKWIYFTNTGTWIYLCDNCDVVRANFHIVNNLNGMQKEEEKNDN